MDLNLICPINQLGYGVASLNILKVATSAGHKVALWPIGNGGDAPQDDHQLLREAFDRTRFFNSAAPSLRIFHQFDQAMHVGKSIHCGLPIFELDKFNDQELHHLKSLDLVFAPSHWAARVLRDNGIENVVIAPFGVDRTIFNETLPTCYILPDEKNGSEKLILGNPNDNETVFLNIGKWEYRKGHDVLQRAFNKAFLPSDNVRLVLCCHNPFIQKDGGNDDWRKFFVNSPMGRAGKISVITERLPAQQNLASLIHRADCGVFPSRAEGWGLPLLEMISCGKTVIATNYSAHTEFCTTQNSILIPAERMEVANDSIWFNGQGSWMEFGKVEIDLLVDAMRRVHGMKQQGLLRRNDDGIETAKRFSWDNTVKHIFSGLEQ